VAQGLTFPSGVTFDDQGSVYVVESGYSYGELWTTPRLLKINGDGSRITIATGVKNGPWTSVLFHDGNFYVSEGGTMEGGRILRIDPQGNISVLVDGLPSFGDHHTDSLAIGVDGWLYFAQGTASNSGVIGEDNAKYGWLKRRPDFHDIPGQDIVLAGKNFETRDVIGNSRQRVRTGAFLPFGTPSKPGQVIRGQVKCSGSVLRVRLTGGEPELVAWGFRNPFGVAFSPQGQLFVTDNGYDNRGSRPVWGAPDVLWAVRPGTWYGWPDFSAGQPLTDRRFKPPWKKRPELVLARHPNPPPQPVARFGVHASANGFDFSRSERFGHVGEAFVAQFGDLAPSVGKVLHPVGFQVVRVDVQTGAIEPFAVNRTTRKQPASKGSKGGLERPIAARFNPAGDALYVVDFGVLTVDRRGENPKTGTGVLWRITRQ
ncbi:MAG: PQQ-dependent sugar dehydrogenase, partial [Limisphaerales bacterium]